MSTSSARRTRRMALCALFAALTAVCSQIAVPTPWGVPINLALFSVYLSGALLGPVAGAASQGVFLALAAVGVPALAGFQGGVGALLGRTGGYAVGYILAALLVGALAARRRGFAALCAAMALGCAACYLFGSVWYVALTGVSLPTAFTLCVLPYLPCDVVKILLAAAVARALDKRLPRGGL